MKNPQESLKKWGDQKWRTSDGKPSKGKKRYLPDAAWDKLSQKEKDATNQAKARGNAKGKQFVAQPKAIAKKKVHRMSSPSPLIRFNALSRRFKPEMKTGASGILRAQIPGFKGTVVAESKSPDVWSVTNASLSREIPKGFGMGRKMYGATIRKAHELSKAGGPKWFLSDSSGRTSGDAAKVWGALKRRGYPVQAAPKAELFKGEQTSAEYGIHLPDMGAFYKDKVKLSSLSRLIQLGKITDEAEAFDPILKKFRMVSVPKLIERTEGRIPKRIHIDKIWGGTRESPGFSEERLKATDTKHPILVDSYYEGEGKRVGLVDGRHRKIKLIERGQKTARIIKITKEDIDHAAYEKFSSPSPLIQFGIVSIGTAKKIFKDISARRPGIKTARPDGDLMSSAFLPKGMNQEHADRYARSQLIEHATPGTVLIPRSTKAAREAERKLLTTEESAEMRRSRPMIYDPVAAALHERGHTLMKKGREAAVVSKINSRTQSNPSEVLREEIAANRRVAGLIRKYGTPAESSEWNRAAQAQVLSHRRHAFYVKSAQAIGRDTGVLPLSAAKDVMRKNPDIRKQNFASPSPLIQLASRWKEVLRTGTDKQKRALISRRGMDLMERKPHLLDPATSGLKRSVTVPEFMRSINEQVRVDRPYPDWASAIEKHPEIASHKPVEMLGLGSSALALKLKNGSVMKIQTRPFSESKWDIQTKKIGEVEVPKHHKAPSGRLHIGIQPMADVQGAKNNYAGTKLLEGRMKKEGWKPGEFKQENFGYVGGKLKYIDADGSYKLSSPSPLIQLGEFLRGMGEPFVKDILKHGMPPGVSITDIPTVAEEYAHKAAYNIYRGDSGKAARENVGLRKLHGRLVKSGLSEHKAGIYSPNPFRPSGAIVKIRVDNPGAETVPGLPHLGERVTKDRIPPERISIHRQGMSLGKEFHRANAPGHGGYSRLSPRQLRLTERAAKRSGGSAVAEAFTQNSKHRSSQELLAARSGSLSDDAIRTRAKAAKKLLVKNLKRLALSSPSPLIQFTSFGATRRLLSSLKSSGVRVVRGDVPIGMYDAGRKAINVPRTGIAAPRGLLWHEAGHAEAHSQGLMDDFLKPGGRTPSAMRGQERLANSLAQKRMTSDGVSGDSIAKWRSERASDLNKYRAGAIGFSTQTPKRKIIQLGLMAKLEDLYAKHPKGMTTAATAIGAGLSGATYYGAYRLIRKKKPADEPAQQLSSPSPLIQLASAAWQRKEGKSASGGLNRKGVASYRRENPGSKLKTAVTTPPSKLDPNSKAAKRRKSFCARMSGMQGPMKKPNGEPTRKALSLRKWNCSSNLPLVQLGIGSAIRNNPKTAIAAGIAAGGAVAAHAISKNAELKKHAWEDREQQANRRSPEDITAALRKRLNTPSAYVSGSEALGIALPGSSDVDIHIPIKSRAKFDRLQAKLGKSFEPMPFNKPGRDHVGYTGKIDGEPVDIAVTYGAKGFEKRAAIRRVAAELTPEKRTQIIAEKRRLKKVWIAPELRYHAYKRGLDVQHGIPLMFPKPLPQEMDSRVRSIQLGIASRLAIAGTAGAGLGVTAALARSPGRPLGEDEDPSGKLLWRRSSIPLIRHYGVGVSGGQVAHVQAGRARGDALFRTESIDKFKAGRPTYVQAERKASNKVLSQIKKKVKTHNLNPGEFDFIKNNCEIAANGALKLKSPTSQAKDAVIASGIGAGVGAAAALAVPKLARIIKNVSKLSSRQGLIKFDNDLQPHQLRVIRRITDPRTSGLVVAHGTGTGKTRTAIESHKALGGDADVVLPAALRANYAKEQARWNGPESNIISQQALSLKGSEALSRPLVIVDEAHRARNPRSKLSDALRGGPAQKRLLLTATPSFNNPSDLASLVNTAAGMQHLPEGKAFQKRYLNPGPIDRWRGKRLSNESELKKKLNEYVDYHKGGGDGTDMPSVTSRTIPVIMSRRQSDLYRAGMGKLPKGVKVNSDNIDRLKAYFTGPRQVSNSSNAFEPGSNEEPKLDRAYADLTQHLKNPKGKALIYSNWLDHGIKPIQRRLDADKTPYGIFTGKESPKVRDQHIRDYNENRTRALLVSSSGAEGLDLKGTRMVQVLEPHFNNSKIRQVVGRSARMGSHSALGPEDRNVEVRQYIARPRNRFFPGSSKGVEDMLAESSRKKDEVDRQITALLSSKMKPIQFTSIGATKRLLRTLRGSGVKIVREDTPKGAEYMPGIEQMFRRGIIQHKPIKEAIEALPPRIKVSRDLALLKKTAMGPREALWHESGHHVSQGADAIHQRKANMKAVADAAGLDMRGQMNVGAEMMKDVTLGKEYRANRGAAKLMSRMGAPERIPLYKKAARKQEAGYENSYEKGALAAALGLHSRRNLIQFANQADVLRHLAGTRWADDPTGTHQEIVKAVTDRATNETYLGPDDIRYVGQGQNMRAAFTNDMLDSKSYAKAKYYQEKVLGNQNTAIKIVTAGDKEKRDLQQNIRNSYKPPENRDGTPATINRKPEIIRTRNQLARALVQQRSILQSARRQQGIPEPKSLKDFVPFKDNAAPFPEYSKRPRMDKGPAQHESPIEAEARKAANARAKAAEDATQKLLIKTNAALDDTSKGSVMRTEQANIRSRYRRGISNLQKRVSRKLAEQARIAGRPIRNPDGVAWGYVRPLAANVKVLRPGEKGMPAIEVPQNPAERYRDLADITGDTPERIEKLHKGFERARKAPDDMVRRRVIRSGRIFRDVAEAAKPIPLPTKFPLLKGIGIGAGILGAGYLGAKLLNRKNNQKQLMSSRTRLIRFGKWEKSINSPLFKRMELRESAGRIAKMLKTHTQAPLALPEPAATRSFGPARYRQIKHTEPSMSEDAAESMRGLSIHRAADAPTGRDSIVRVSQTNPGRDRTARAYADQLRRIQEQNERAAIHQLYKGGQERTAAINARNAASEQGRERLLAGEWDDSQYEKMTRDRIRKQERHIIRKEEGQRIGKAAGVNIAKARDELHDGTRLHKRQMNDAKIDRDFEREETKQKIADLKHSHLKKTIAAVGSGIVIGGGLGWGARKPDEETQFSEKEGYTLKQKAAIGAGGLVAAGGLSLLPAALAIGRIPGRGLAAKAIASIGKVKGLRGAFRAPKKDMNSGGKMVADYLDAAQSALNSGVHGKLAGVALRRAVENPKGIIAKTIGDKGDGFASSHYARFRSGPKEAMGHWDYEHGLTLEKRGAGRPAEWLKSRQDKMHFNREATQAEINDQLWNRGKSESEAIRHVATKSQNPKVQAYFNELASHKREAANKYAKIALLSPAAIIAGGGIAAAGAKGGDRNKRELSSIQKLILFSRGEYTMDLLRKNPGRASAPSFADQLEAINNRGSWQAKELAADVRSTRRSLKREADIAKSAKPHLAEQAAEAAYRAKKIAAYKKPMGMKKAGLIGAGLAGVGALGYTAGRSVNFAEKKKHSHPALIAGASAGVTGALVAGIPSALRTGSKVLPTLKVAGKVGGTLAGLAGGSVLIGNAISGDPKKSERAAYTKRAAIGGGIGGTIGGGIAGLLAMKTTKGRAWMAKHAEHWRPVAWANRAGPAAAAAVGAIGGGGYGIYQGIDEGSGVDALHSGKTKRMSSRLQPIQFRASYTQDEYKISNVHANNRAYALGGLGLIAGGIIGHRVGSIGKKMAQTEAAFARRSAETARDATRRAESASAGWEGSYNRMRSHAERTRSRAAEADDMFRQARQAQEEATRRAREHYGRSTPPPRSSYQETRSAREDTPPPRSGGVNWDDFFGSHGFGGAAGSARSNTPPPRRAAPPQVHPKMPQWEAARRMAKESPHEGERANAKVAANKLRKKHGMNVEELSRRGKLIQFGTNNEVFVNQGLTGKLAQDRYRKKIKDEDLDRRDANILRSTLAGAGLGAALRGTMPAKYRALIGAGAGAATAIGTRLATRQTADLYGERSREAKTIEGLPYKLAGAAAIGVAGKRGYDKLKATKIAAGKLARGVAGAGIAGLGLYGASQLFSSRRPVIQFEDWDRYYDAPKLKKEYRPQVKKRDWTTKWVGGTSKSGKPIEVNTSRRVADLRRGYSRATGLVGDVKGVLTGEKSVDARGRPKKREWEKPWVQNVAMGLVLGGAGIASIGVRRAAQSGVMRDIADRISDGRLAGRLAKDYPRLGKAAKFIAGVRPRLEDEAAGLVQKGEGLGHRFLRWIDKGKEATPPPNFNEVNKKAQDALKARLEKLNKDINTSAREQLNSIIRFDEYEKDPTAAGRFTLRDPRGRSVRVYAGDKGPHYRTPQKELDKKKYLGLKYAALLGSGLVAGTAFGAFGGNPLKNKIAKSVLEQIPAMA